MKRLIIIIGIVLVVGAFAALLFLRKDTSVVNPGEVVTNNFPNQTGPLEFPSQASPDADNTKASPLIPNPKGEAFVPELSGNATNTTFVNQTKSLKRISEARVTSGEITVGTVKGLDIFVRYMEAGTGHVYDFRPVGDARERVSGVTIPRVAETYWGDKGQSALLRYFDETGGVVKNYLVRFSSSATSSDKLSGIFISDQITDVAIAPTGEERTGCAGTDKMSLVDTGLFTTGSKDEIKAFQTKYGIEATGFVGPKTRAKINSIYCAKVGGQVTGSRLAYVVTDGTGTKVVSSDFDGRVTTNRFSSVLTEWRLLWPSKDSLALVTAPASSVTGYGYQLVGATLKPLVWEVAGLTMLVSPKFDRVVYSQSTARGLRTLVKNMKDGSTRDFPIITLPQDKCVWSRVDTNIIYCAAPTQTLVGGYPDLWYQSRVSFSDNIYSVNLETDTVTLLYSASASDSDTDAPDVINLIVAEDDSYLFFKNKKDGFLYELPVTGLSAGE